MGAGSEPRRERKVVNRTFDAQGLIILPKLDAGSAFSIGEELLTRAKDEEELAEPIADEVKKMKHAVAELGEALRSRFEPTGEEHKMEAHREAAARWKGVHDMLTAWAELNQGKKSDLAQRMLNAMFADGLSFTRAAYRTAWTESDQRLEWLEEEELDEAFAELGGAEFLKELRAAHRKYGEALGIKKVTEAKQAASLREPFDALLARIRKYVVQVTAHGELDVAGAREQAARLLTPLVEFQSARAKAPAKEEEPEAAPVTEPTATPPPASTPPTPRDS